MANEITILLADDHNVVRQSLRAMLDHQPDFSVVGEAGDGLEAVRLAERLRPRVLVVDLRMPGLPGIEVVRQLTERAPETRTLVLSIESDKKNVQEALTNGATGYVVKDAPASDLIQAIRDVAAGKRYLSPELSELALSAYVKDSQAREQDPYEKLTSREREVLHLAAQGNTNAQIAKRLFISPRTVEIHRASLMRKLHLKKSVELIMYALRRGIIPADWLVESMNASQATAESQTKPPRKKRPARPKHSRR
ncbi:MAG TPA: response regulator transcription factor [Candidatus Binatia bacterium]|jgi:DNA-binding NarL/FixJ family response regulator